MNRLALVKLLTCAAPILMGACTAQDNMGYPDKLTFPKTGGEKTIYGNYPIGGLTLSGGQFVFARDFFYTKIGFKVCGDTVVYEDGYAIPLSDNTENDHSIPVRYTDKDTLHIAYDWIKIVHIKGSNCITITVSENNTPISRDMVISSWINDEKLKIKVKQKSKP